jgi:hypothetical protein
MSRARISRAFAGSVVLVTLAAAAHAAPPAKQTARTSVRSGNHPGFGRVVVDTNGKTAYRLEQDGDHVVMHFADDVTLGNAPAPPRNVIAITTDGATADLILVHGAKIHPMRMDGRVVLDVLDNTDKAAAPAKPRRGETLSEPIPQRHSRLAMASSPELGGRSVTAATPPIVAASRSKRNLCRLPSHSPPLRFRM